MKKNIEATIFKALFSTGIGRATAIRFAAEGCKVFATDVNEELLRELETHEGQFYKLKSILGLFQDG